MTKGNHHTRVLWIAPNFNHYKKRFLNRLVEEGEIKLELLMGKTPHKEGHKGDVGAVNFDIVEVNVTKKYFPYHPKVYFEVLKYTLQGGEKTILMPIEKKLFLLIIWIRFLRIFRKFFLVSYNHPVMRSRRDKITKKDMKWTRILFSLYDRIVFYTEKSRDWAVKNKLAPYSKAYFANNTLDTKQIFKDYPFEINSGVPPRILFIARLIPSKRVDLALTYFQALKKAFPDIELTVIGDGPDAPNVREAVSQDANIKWCGALIDETKIAKEMRAAHMVFVPGESGLSIIHAFAYGKPYLTLEMEGQAHGPELDYLRHAENGLLLAGNMDENIEQIVNILKQPKIYENMCQSAYSSAQDLSIDKWCIRMTEALNPHTKQ